MSDPLDLITRDFPSFYLPPDVPPSWWPQLQEIARRLGVEPTTGDPDSVLLFAYHDEKYDGGAILLALLDRLDSVA